MRTIITFRHKSSCVVLILEISYIVWSEKDLFIERAYLDNEFTSDAMDKAIVFFKVAVLPKLVGKWYSKYQYRAHLMLSHTLLITKKQRTRGASADKRSQVK